MRIGLPSTSSVIVGIVSLNVICLSTPDNAFRWTEQAPIMG
jgi:hypothetical protein